MKTRVGQRQRITRIGEQVFVRAIRLASGLDSSIYLTIAKLQFPLSRFV
jgi:hypothetical protein